jgi:hypothetical protein
MVVKKQGAATRVLHLAEPSCRSWPLVSLLPIAAGPWAGQVRSRSSFACPFAGQPDGWRCPAVTDGLDGFWLASDNPAAGAGMPHLSR